MIAIFEDMINSFVALVLHGKKIANEVNCTVTVHSHGTNKCVRLSSLIFKCLYTVLL